jgi:hypothetical protein
VLRSRGAFVRFVSFVAKPFVFLRALRGWTELKLGAARHFVFFVPFVAEAS